MAIPKSIHFNVEGNKITTWTGQGLGAYAFYGVLGILIFLIGAKIGTSPDFLASDDIGSFAIMLLACIPGTLRAARQPSSLCFDGDARTIFQKNAFGTSQLMPFDEVEDIFLVQAWTTWNTRVYFRLMKKGDLPGKGIQMTDSFELSEYRFAEDADNFACFQKKILPMLRAMLRLKSSPQCSDSDFLTKADAGHVIHCGRDVILHLTSFSRWIIAVIITFILAFTFLGFNRLYADGFLLFFSKAICIASAVWILLGIPRFPLLIGTPLKVTLNKMKRSFVITPLLYPKEITIPFDELQYFKLTTQEAYDTLPVVTMHLKSLKKGVPLTILRDPAEGEKFLPNLLAAAGIRRDIPVYYADRAPLANFKELPKKK